MITLDLQIISKILNAKRIGKNHTIFTIETDSRNIQYKKQCLFVALCGNKYNGHNFVEKAISLGAIAILVNCHFPFLKIPQLIVSDTLNALNKLSHWIRKQFTIPIVAITGSSGKTTVKEMTASILRQTGKVLCTKKNFNNHIGVSLTLLKLNKKHNFGVIEIGANQFGEIYQCAKQTSPKSALINNIFLSHLNGFKSLQGIAKAKSEIFTGLPNKGYAILNNDNNYFPLWKGKLKNKKILRFSKNFSKHANIFSKNIRHHTKGTSFTLCTKKGTCKIYIPLLGNHNVSNALAAITSAISVNKNITLLEITTGLKQIKKIPGRLFPIPLNKNHLLLDDSYNSNIGSLIEGAKVLENMPGYKIMVIGDILEMGEKKIQYHKIAGKLIKKINIDEILSFGYLSKYITRAIDNHISKHFNDNISLISYLLHSLSKNIKITILIKGSRNTKMEEIIFSLQEKYHVQMSY
ncbi:MAG: D-alanyl-D-alanine-adding enzyme [Candidatus Westeberhardia cardiocondylae]|nr:D-alanyl-D-alanine-adding enzyme [Candidatus Westeberhardia cardiocondylae]